MTNEKNLDWLYRLRSAIYTYMPQEWLIPMNNALDEAIKKLEQSNSDGDYISRQAVIDELNRLKNDTTPISDTKDFACNHILTFVEKLPSIQPKPKTGHWEWGQYDSNPEIGNFHCSECNFMPASFNWASKHLNYCPNCGAKMEGTTE